MRVATVQPKSNTSGIAFVGEAPGEEEQNSGTPFIGRSGQLFDTLLTRVGISRESCLITNTFKTRPRGNNIQEFFIRKSAFKGMTSPHPPFAEKGFVAPQFESDLTQLYDELLTFKPKVIVALGATALWALTGETRITTFRGYYMRSAKVAGCPLVTTFHPTTLLRQWQYVPIALRDLTFAKKISEDKFTLQPHSIWVAENFNDILKFQRYYMTNLTEAAVDIETKQRSITHICVTPSENISLVIPLESFTDEDAGKSLTWLAKEILMNKAVTKVMQNGVYDLTYFSRYGIPIRGPFDDTMLLAHSYQPEMEKGLGFLASFYLETFPWKHLRVQPASEVNKADE